MNEQLAIICYHLFYLDIHEVSFKEIEWWSFKQ